MRCNARHENCLVYHGPWVTRSGKIAVRNRRGAIKYFTTRSRAAYAFRHDETIQRRNYSAERYERRRQGILQKMKTDPSNSGYLGNIFPGLFPPIKSLQGGSLD